MYDRTISIARPNASSGVAAQGYSGTQPVGESVIMSGLPAEIQLTRRVGKPDPALAADTQSLPGFNILIPAAYATLGQITERDIVIDDLGKRYSVIGAYWNVLGYNLSTALLET